MLRLYNKFVCRLWLYSDLEPIQAPMWKGQSRSRQLFKILVKNLWGFFLHCFTCLILHPYYVGMIKHMLGSIYFCKVYYIFCLHDFYYIGPFEMVTVSMVSNFFKTNSNLVGMSLSKSYNRSVYVGSKTTITLMIWLIW